MNSQPNGPLFWTRRQFLTAVQSALIHGQGFATAKIGASELHRLNYGLIIARSPDGEKLAKVLEPMMVYQTLHQSALFPATPDFFKKFSKLEGENLKRMDCIGVFPEMWDRVRMTLANLNADSPVIDYQLQEPDRSSPSNPENCYLPYLRDKRLLIVSSFARLACERARKDSFEAVWEKTGKKWFYPQTVDYLEFPFGFAETTHRQYASSLELLDEITNEMNSRQFDCALIGAGGLGIHIAAHAKQMGHVGISLGGHLQPLFGIQGKRWRERPAWQEMYVNESWIDLPDEYRPAEASVSGDQGSYW